MDIVQLKYFCAVAESGSLRNAARLVGVSPSALSKAIGQLEAGLGVALFAREGRGIVLTDDGKRVRERATRIVADFERLRAETRAGPAVAPALRVATFEVFSSRLLGEVARRAFADAALLVLERAPGDLERAVACDEADLGITYAPVATGEVELVPVARFGMAVFARAGAFARAGMREAPFAVPITPVGGNVAGFRSLDGWPEDRLPRTVRYRCELLETALDLARRGMCIVHVPRFVAALANRTADPQAQLVEIAAPVAEPMTTYLVRRRAAPESRAFRRLAKHLRACVTEP
jgi:DNA-binding transcriptional LysR family regulator